MKEFIYSANNNAFYPIDMRDDYEAAGTWPDDGEAVDRKVFVEFTCATPAGKVRQPGPDGLPVWADLPPVTMQELIAQVEAKRQQLLFEVDTVTADWRTELALGDISDEDREKLSAWMAYKREVKAVSSQDAVMDNFAWPSPPVQQH